MEIDKTFPAMLGWNTFHYVNWRELYHNKANLRDLIAGTGLVNLFGLCDLEIGPMALKNNRDFLPCPFQLCVSFHSHQCLQLGLTVRKRSNRVKIGIFVSHDHRIGQMTLKNNMAPFLCLFYFHASFRRHQCIQLWVAVTDISELEPLKLGQIWRFCACCDLEFSRMTLKNNRALLLYPFKLYASFHGHWWI